MNKTTARLYIDGEWSEGTSERASAVVNPATEETIGEVAFASRADLDRALAAAAHAFVEWREWSPWERGETLKKAAALIRERTEPLAESMTREQGKPVAEAKGEMERTIETFQWCGEEATRTHGRLWPARAPGTRQMIVKQPIGPVAAFSPWNFPAVLSARKIAPALAAGCSVVIKPAEETPGVCAGIVQALADAGVPPGVVNLVHGEPAEVSEHLVRSPVIRKVSLTGSVTAGRAVSHLAAEGLKNATMELGGHAPVIVFDDVDAAKVAKMTAGFKFRNAGQVCLAPSRIYVQQDAYRSFVDRFVEVAKALEVGDGMAPTTQMGPLANRRRLEAMERMVADAESRGGVIATGGRRIGNKGFFFEPTVVLDVPDDAEVMTVEPFGPIVPIVPFLDFEEVMARANVSELGLAGYAFTASLERGTAAADAIEAGWIGINNFSPFLADAPGGGMKESGYGYEGGPEGLDAYMHSKFVSQATL